MGAGGGPVPWAVLWCGTWSRTSEFEGQFRGQDEAMSVLVPMGTGWREAPNAAMHLKGLIRLDVRVHDAAGNAIGGLGREHFTVLDQGQPESIMAFRSSAAAGGPSPEVSVVVMLDTLDLPQLANQVKASGFPDPMTEERQQVVAFLRANGGRLPWPVTVYTYEDSGLYLTAEASRDGNAEANAVLADEKNHPLPLLAPAPLPAFSPETEGAVELAARQRRLNGRVPPASTGLQALANIGVAQDLVPGRKVLLWVGPGLLDVGTGAYPERWSSGSRDAGEDYRKPTALGAWMPPEVKDAEVRQGIFDNAYWFLTLLRQAGMTVDVFSAGENFYQPLYLSRLGHTPNQQKRWLQVLDVWKNYDNGLDGPDHAKGIDLYKKVLAVESGGRVLPDEHDIAQQMAECLRSADTYYTMTFNPAHADHEDDLHALAVKVDLPGLAADTVHEYYDEPYYNDPPYGGARPMTVAELESNLLAANGSDGQVRVLQGVALTERLTEAEQAKLRPDVRGGKAQATLAMLADEAEFEPPSDSEVLTDPAPSVAEQQKMLARAQQYLEKTIPRLPDFFAVRQAVRFASTPVPHPGFATRPSAPLHQTDAWKANVLYRQGQEVVLQKSQGADANHTLHTYGTFGPVLFTLRSALEYAPGISWRRWQSGSTGKEAVFAFAVPNTVPHQYGLVDCCVPDRAGDVQFQLLPGYHGELTVDPGTGAILRFQLEADLAGFAPAEQSGIMVTYGPVTISGHTYILPQRSVSLVRARTMTTLREWNLSFRTWGPEHTSMEVFAFDHYREFRATVKMLPTKEPH